MGARPIWRKWSAARWADAEVGRRDVAREEVQLALDDLVGRQIENIDNAASTSPLPLNPVTHRFARPRVE
jgi:hypothetical protein